MVFQIDHALNAATFVQGLVEGFEVSDGFGIWLLWFNDNIQMATTGQAQFLGFLCCDAILEKLRACGCQFTLGEFFE